EAACGLAGGGAQGRALARGRGEADAPHGDVGPGLARAAGPEARGQPGAAGHAAGRAGGAGDRAGAQCAGVGVRAAGRGDGGAGLAVQRPDEGADHERDPAGAAASVLRELRREAAGERADRGSARWRTELLRLTPHVTQGLLRSPAALALASPQWIGLLSPFGGLGAWGWGGGSRSSSSPISRCAFLNSRIACPKPRAILGIWLGPNSSRITSTMSRISVEPRFTEVPPRFLGLFPGH